ncbi:MAG TPA: response regulator [Cytophagaceae bacterium]|jgi:CheY-like chemotaxis protein
MEKLNCVLLVDDDNVTNFLTERLIKKLDLCDNVKISHNGEEALLYLAQHCCAFDAYNFPELILLDNNMPEMNGIEFLEMINQININSDHRIKIVLLTNNDDEEINKKVKELGVESTLTKPLTEEKLKDILLHQ